MDLQETRQLLTEYDIRPTRSLGQNFLIDDRVVDRVCEGIELTQNDFLLEIGPGLGSLTRELSAAKAVSAVEIDRHMVEVLSATLSEFNNISIIHADALKTDFCGLAEGHDSVKVAANLPYYITTQLIEKLLIELARSKLMLLMMQKEAADRLFALPGNKLYGPVSVLVSLYGKAMKYQKVSASSYYPRPHVDSV
ncbi:MAG: ribosomal RNA small subunit methyltransferase A, partial [Clostridiaceae bacterium]|nr:ribosomal RNA small subunit methyltransferase A [Clostridiaceae bacterium]